MTLDANAFNFDSLKETLGADPFASSANKFARDERFYTLAKDKEGNGAALIRFLPDSERGMIQRMFKINTTITTNGKKRFVSEFSPATIGAPCPFQEKWQALWNANDKEGAKVYSRGIRYIANIKVLKDPANPENDGKIFMYEMSGAMKDKIQAAVDPSEQDRALGATPKELFNPLKGNSFRLVAKKGANGQINYDSSEVVNEVTSIYDSVEEALADIKENTYKLSDLLKPESFLSYDELVKKLEWVESNGAAPAAPASPTSTQSTPLVAEVQTDKSPVKAEVQPAQPAQPAQSAQPAQPTQPAQSDNLDDLLSNLL